MQRRTLVIGGTVGALLIGSFVFLSRRSKAQAGSTNPGNVLSLPNQNYPVVGTASLPLTVGSVPDIYGNAGPAFPAGSPGGIVNPGGPMRSQSRFTKVMVGATPGTIAPGSIPQINPATPNQEGWAPFIDGPIGITPEQFKNLFTGPGTTINVGLLGSTSAYEGINLPTDLVS